MSEENDIYETQPGGNIPNISQALSKTNLSDAKIRSKIGQAVPEFPDFSDFSQKKDNHLRNRLWGGCFQSCYLQTLKKDGYSIFRTFSCLISPHKSAMY